MGNLFDSPAKRIRDGVVDAASIASENISRAISNSADVASQNMSTGMQNSTKIWSQAWSQTVRYAVDSTFVTLPKASRDFLYNATVAWGDAWNESVQTMSIVGERTVRDVVPYSSRMFLSDAASKLSQAWIQSTNNMGTVAETAGVSMSTKFCQNAAELFQNALITVSDDMKTTLPHTSQLFMHNAAAQLSKALLSSTKMVIESSESTLPKMAELFLVEAAVVWSDAWRETMPHTAQVHLKDAAVELKQGLIKSVIIASVASIIVSIICNNGLLNVIFEFLRPYVFIAFLFVFFYQQQKKSMQNCFDKLAKENKTNLLEIQRLGEFVVKLSEQNKEFRNKFQNMEDQVPFLMKTNDLPYTIGNKNGCHWLSFTNVPRTIQTERFLSSVLTYHIYLKWNLMDLKSDIIGAHSYQTFCAESPKITTNDDSSVYWNIRLKHNSEDVSLSFFVSPLDEEQQFFSIRRKVACKIFVSSTNYGDIINTEEECDCECFPFGDNKKQPFALKIDKFIGLKELQKYLEKSNDLTLVVYASVWKLP